MPNHSHSYCFRLIRVLLCQLFYRRAGQCHRNSDRHDHCLSIGAPLTEHVQKSDTEIDDYDDYSNFGISPIPDTPARPTGDPAQINRSISHCAKSPQKLYEQGTTLFTMALQTGHSIAPTTSTTALQRILCQRRPSRTLSTTNLSPGCRKKDWPNCLDAGNTEEECRQMLN